MMSLVLFLITIGCSDQTQAINEMAIQKTVIEKTKPVQKIVQKPQIAPKSKSIGLTVPNAQSIESEHNAQEILLGKDLIDNTHVRLPENVNAKINCTNCHLQSGTVPNAMPFVGVDDRYPKYRARSGKEDDIRERINGCFQRSMNGNPLLHDSTEMNAMVAYMEWVSSLTEDGSNIEGAGLAKLTPLTPDMDNGKLLYASKCQMCHQANGEGLFAPDGMMIYPPLWGEDSFNLGAGMARLNTAAAFIKWNMPFGQGGSLTDQEAYDIAAYLTTQERPDFDMKTSDWPKGGKPNDARY